MSLSCILLAHKVLGKGEEGMAKEDIMEGHSRLQNQGFILVFQIGPSYIACLGWPRARCDPPASDSQELGL